ncbi:phosphohydrolase [Pseudoflavitalea sp. X16]|uniref:phosphohydrolase n=1 Tax=Paraflavitalea devenefica TaxID=2716334 RepID=UPI00141F5FDD|nr:phosphohydrolase [Paraflavitalea devenefica]NII27627.1 phosphohydrolase [Paraflavitalea devenefica]
MEYTNAVIETLLLSFQPVMGKDFAKYRNHVYRVFLNCGLIDPDHQHQEKYAVVAVFHDIGIWTDHTIDYLDPSIAQLNQYLTATGRQEWMEECSEMIQWHHKTSRYNGPYAQTVETFRKADWIDVSLGLITYGVDKQTISANRRMLPNRSFHWFLVRKIVRNLFRHPLNPLPMFRR